MKSVNVSLCVACVVACHADIDPPEATTMSKVSPSSVSTADAWKLFDRSVSSKFTPDDKPVVIQLDRAEPIAAIKVYGPAPYKLDVQGALGFDPVDLSTLDRGWHVFTTNAITSTN